MSEKTLWPTSTSYPGARDVDYVYDDLYRLVSETVTDATLGDRTSTWTYDAVGNRLSEVETTAAGTDTTTYSYDDNDRLLTETVTGLNPATITYSYDNNGNTLTRIDGSGTTSYAYDSRNRLSDLNAGQTTYLYDASGIRMSETSSGLTTNYLVDPNRDYAQVVEESFDLNSFAEVRYTYGDDLIAQHRRVDAITTNSSTYHHDGIGSVRRLTDTNSQVTDSYAFTAFGELEGSTGTTQNDYLYTGEQYDPNLGFYYLRARYFDAATASFLSRDTFYGYVEEPLSSNAYRYVHANPVNFVDPSGHSIAVQQSLALKVNSILSATLVTASQYVTRRAVLKVTIGIGLASLFHEVHQDIVFAEQSSSTNSGDERQRQKEYEDMKRLADMSFPPPPPPGSGGECSRLSRSIDHAEAVIKRYKAWDAKWSPGRHASKIENWERRMKNLKEQHKRRC